MNDKRVQSLLRGREAEALEHVARQITTLPNHSGISGANETKAVEG
jgi:hypothetical protein